MCVMFIVLSVIVKSIKTYTIRFHGINLHLKAIQLIDIIIN